MFEGLRRSAGIVVMVAFALTACDKKASEAPPPPPAAKTSAPAAVTKPVEAAGPGKTTAPLPGDHPEAFVTDIAQLKDGGKIYSTAGGDPAINGLYTFIASPFDPAEGLRVFQIGDFNSWKLIEERGTDAVLEVSRSWIDDKGDVQTAVEFLIVSVPSGESKEITITPAKR